MARKHDVELQSVSHENRAQDGGSDGGELENQQKQPKKDSKVKLWVGTGIALFDFVTDVALASQMVNGVRCGAVGKGGPAGSVITIKNEEMMTFSVRFLGIILFVVSFIGAGAQIQAVRSGRKTLVHQFLRIIVEDACSLTIQTYMLLWYFDILALVSNTTALLALIASFMSITFSIMFTQLGAVCTMLYGCCCCKREKVKNGSQGCMYALIAAAVIALIVNLFVSDVNAVRDTHNLGAKDDPLSRGNPGFWVVQLGGPFDNRVFVCRNGAEIVDPDVELAHNQTARRQFRVNYVGNVSRTEENTNQHEVIRKRLRGRCVVDSHSIVDIYWNCWGCFDEPADDSCVVSDYMGVETLLSPNRYANRATPAGARVDWWVSRRVLQGSGPSSEQFQSRSFYATDTTNRWVFGVTINGVDQSQMAPYVPVPFLSETESCFL